MTGIDLSLDLADEAATRRLGEDVAAALRKGDLVTLSGDLGSGKTTLARALIRALTADPGLEVPSPTYTLAQTYVASLPVAHFDLFRLSDPREVDDLGVEEALTAGVALVEWPEHGAGALPAPAIAIALAEAADGTRTAQLMATGGVAARLERSLRIRTFLRNAGWGDAMRAHLTGDASTRRYETVALAGQPPCLVMDAPEQPDGPPIRGGLPYSRIARLSESVTPFVAIAHALRREGFAAPEIFAADLDAGILLLEHLGRNDILDAARRPIPGRYEAAIALLAEIHRRDWPARIEAPFGAVHAIPPYDRDAMAIEVELLLDWYAPAMAERTIDDSEREDFSGAWTAVFDRLDGVERNLVLRDFHSPNIIWRGDRDGFDRLGLIDFQDALIGPSAYDVASLAQDARATVEPELEAGLLAGYCLLRHADENFDEERFRMAYAIMSAQRCSKILGIFVRLDRRDGKPDYLKHLPRMRDYLGRSIRHEALTPVREIYQRWGLLGGETL